MWDVIEQKKDSPCGLPLFPVAYALKAVFYAILV